MSRLPEVSLLRALAVFSRSPSLAEAARALGVTQPTLSYQLKRLEASVPIPVFTFEGKRKVLTHYGRALRDMVEGQLGRIEDAFETMNQHYLSANQLTIRVGCRRDRFLKVEKCIRFSGKIVFHDLSAGDALAALQAHRVDVAIVHAKPDLPNVVAKRLFFSGPRFVVHKKWLKKGDGKIESLERLARDREFLERTPCLRYHEKEEFIAQWIQLHGADPERVQYRYTCQDWMALMRWAAEGQGYALVPGDFSIDKDLDWWDVPSAELPGLYFYAAYHSDLRRIPGFGKDLVIEEFKQEW